MHTKWPLSVLAMLMIIVGRPATAATLDETIPPGHNYDKAEFRLWYPDAAGKAWRAILTETPFEP